MTQLTFAIAATHDHWFEEPAARPVYPAVRLWWRHFSKQHPGAQRRYVLRERRSVLRRNAASLLLPARAECQHNHAVQGENKNGKSSIEAGFLR
jgi:hypothetical protein